MYLNYTGDSLALRINFSHLSDFDAPIKPFLKLEIQSARESYCQI